MIRQDSPICGPTVQRGTVHIFHLGSEFVVEIYRSKFEETVRRLEAGTGSLMDIGCRDGTLRTFLPKQIAYTGIDLSPGPNVTQVCNVEEGIPFPNSSFDVVVALDVLEHLDNIWFAFAEMVRVARRQVMVVLPNMYHYRDRMRYLRGRQGDKYLLSPEPIQDRHRWVTSYRTAHAFCRHQAARHGLSVTESIMVDDRRNVTREILAQALPPNFMAIASFHVFTKRATQSM